MVWNASAWTFGLGRVLPKMIQLCIGLYLFRGGDWIVNRVIPTNRPYCHECGYDLTGSGMAGECPECGTAFVRR